MGSDGKLHFVNSEGADSVLNFSSKPFIASSLGTRKKSVIVTLQNVTPGTYTLLLYSMYSTQSSGAFIGNDPSIEIPSGSYSLSSTDGRLRTYSVLITTTCNIKISISFNTSESGTWGNHTDVIAFLYK